jgi:hypothetical protein
MSNNANVFVTFLKPKNIAFVNQTFAILKIIKSTKFLNIYVMYCFGSYLILMINAENT